LWLTALVSGLAAAILYLIKKDWRWPLGVAGLSIVVIFLLTFVQPSIMVRFLLDTGLVAGLVWTARKSQ
jgi:hypothetical protein